MVGYGGGIYRVAHPSKYDSVGVLRKGSGLRGDIAASVLNV
jgi:hypothetical protein